MKALTTVWLAALLTLHPAHAQPAKEPTPTTVPTTAPAPVPDVKAATPALTPEQAAVKQGVLKVLRAMEAAVLAADAKAYLALLDPRDPVFVQEQKELVEDLKKNKAASFALEIVESQPEGGPDEPGGGGAPLFAAERATLRLKQTWAMEKWKSPRTLVMPVVFTRNAATGQWRYAGEHWDEVIAEPKDAFEGARILFEPGNDKLRALAADIVKVMPKVRASVDAHFKFKAPGPVVVKLYRSMKHLQASIWLSYTDSLGGWNEPGESIKILTSNRSTAEGLSGTIAHEYGHCVTFHMGPHATDAAWWALEGAADYAAADFKGRTAKRRDDQVARWMREGKLGEWSRMAAFPLAEEDRHLMQNVYVQGEHMMAFLQSRYGADARILFVRRLCEGKSVEAAAKEATGQTWADVDAAWKQSIQQGMSTEPKED